MSEESLRKTGDFDARTGRTWARVIKEGRVGFAQRAAVELGLVAVLATQLWHHIYIDGTLADLPAGWQRLRPAAQRPWNAFALRKAAGFKSRFPIMRLWFRPLPDSPVKIVVAMEFPKH